MLSKIFSKDFPIVAFGQFGGAGLYAEFCKGGANLGYFKKRGEGVKLQAASQGALEDNVIN